MTSPRIWPRLKRRLLQRLIDPETKLYWGRQHLLSLVEVQQEVRQAILSGQPTCVARIGGVEASLLLWAQRIPLRGKLLLRLPTLYSETEWGPSHAGLRPRSRGLYRQFAELARDALRQTDFLEVWQTPYEHAIIQALHLRSRCFSGELLSPTMDCTPHWLEALSGKRVLVVSPFVASIEQQLSKLSSVWSTRRFDPLPRLQTIPFPYLIEKGCQQRWPDVWDRIRKEVETRDYDVALFGCGGLGLPLAAAAKKTGRIGIHMGGLLQLVFGIYGQRHLEQPWHRRWINDSWVRPSVAERPHCAANLENGCYW